jgi:sugar phosphate isomerase/epimerase
MALKIGVQLYSVREYLKIDPVGTLEKVVAAGYSRLEAANGNAAADPGVGLGMPAGEVCDLLDRLGASIIGSHVMPFDDTNCRAVLDYHKAVGSRNIILPIMFFRDEADRMGEICEAEGMRFFYHNHYHEFQKTGGECILDIIAESTDPRYVNFELDTYWAMRAGMDPVRVLRHYGSRVKAIHQKDFAMPDVTDSPVNLLEKLNLKEFIPAHRFGEVILREDFAEIGTGRMDIQAILDAANALGSVEDVILEQDFSRFDALESLRVSMEGFKKFKGIDWT